MPSSHIAAQRRIDGILSGRCQMATFFNSQQSVVPDGRRRRMSQLSPRKTQFFNFSGGRSVGRGGHLTAVMSALCVRWRWRRFFPFGAIVHCEVYARRAADESLARWQTRGFEVIH